MKVINLLPKPRQEELHFEAMLRSLLTVCVYSAFSFVLVFVIQFAVKFYLQYQTEYIKNEIKVLQGKVAEQQNSNVKVKVNTINNLITDYNNLAETSPKWSKVIKAFIPLVPEQVKIVSFNVDPNTKSVNITGVSPTREKVIDLYNNVLKDNKSFYNINYPLENVAKPTNVNFHFTFLYKDDLLK